MKKLFPWYYCFGLTISQQRVNQITWPRWWSCSQEYLLSLTPSRLSMIPMVFGGARSAPLLRLVWKGFLESLYDIHWSTPNCPTLQGTETCCERWSNRRQISFTIITVTLVCVRDLNSHQFCPSEVHTTPGWEMAGMVECPRCHQKLRRSYVQRHMRMHGTMFAISNIGEFWSQVGWLKRRWRRSWVRLQGPRRDDVAVDPVWQRQNHRLWWCFRHGPKGRGRQGANSQW